MIKQYLKISGGDPYGNSSFQLFRGFCDGEPPKTTHAIPNVLKHLANLFAAIFGAKHQQLSESADGE